MSVYTLTLNPAFDLHCHADQLRLQHENIARILSLDAGGKGINISRALLALGRNSRALVLAGSENGADFLRLAAESGLTPDALTVSGRIRENITVHAPQEGLRDGREAETRISFPGFCLSAQDKETVLSWLQEKLSGAVQGDVLTLTGSLPQGLTSGDLTPFLQNCKDRGLRLVIDSNAFSPEDLKTIAPWLIKPNREEIAHYLGQEEACPEAILDWTRDMNQSGVTNALVTLGPDGAILATREGIFRADTPDIPILSTIGAGDSTLAGFTEGYLQGLSTAGCLALAMATGTAACLTEGTCPPQADTIRQLTPQIHVQKVHPDH